MDYTVTTEKPIETDFIGSAKFNTITLSEAIENKDVGRYVINKEMNVFFKNKPNVFNRFFTRLFLGWIWKDEQ